MGSRGIPARYGGYETLMEELGVRLADLGHEVTVFCRSHYTPPDLKEYRGVRLETLPTLRTKYLDTPVHTLLSALRCLSMPFDAALVVNSANALFVPLMKLSGMPVALHVDGIEKRRAKWGALGRWVYALSERLACVLPDVLITDALCIQEHYRERYGAESVEITYGVDPRPAPGEAQLESLGLKPRQYFLYVSRFEPENNPHRVVEAYAEVGGDLPLVMVGGAPYANAFIRGWSEGADPRVLFPGPIYGDGYHQLLANARAYVQATEVGGTHPALVEAMGYGNCLLVNDTPENREVAGEPALYFRAENPESLTACFEWARTHPDESRKRGEAAGLRAAECYNWDGVTSRYLELFRSMAGYRGSN